MRGHRPPGSLEELFWPKVRKGDGCWEWQACLRTTGYGEMGWPGHDGKRISAHRASWLINYGEILDGLWVLHRVRQQAVAGATFGAVFVRRRGGAYVVVQTVEQWAALWREAV